MMHRLNWPGRSRGTITLAAALAQKDEIVHHDLGHLALLPILLPLPRLELPFNVTLVTLAQILLCDSGGSSTEGDSMPLSPLLLLSILVLPLFLGREVDIRDRSSVAERLDFRGLGLADQGGILY